MNSYPIWRSKEVKSVFLKVMGQNPDGTIAVSFAVSHFVPAPKHMHNYQKDYLEQYYEKTGDVQNWIIDPKLIQLPNAAA